MTVRTKICGFTRAEDLDAAIALGVDAVGLNVAKGPRKISVDQAAAARPSSPRCCWSSIPTSTRPWT